MFFSLKFNTDSLVISIYYNICMLISAKHLFRKLTYWKRMGNFKQRTIVWFPTMFSLSSTCLNNLCQHYILRCVNYSPDTSWKQISSISLCFETSMRSISTVLGNMCRQCLCHALMINGLVQLLENLAVGLKQDRELYIPYTLLYIRTRVTICTLQWLLT